MSSLCNADYEIGPMKTYDSRIPTPPLSDEEVERADVNEFVMHDTEAIEDGFDDDTQVLCLAGETQLLDGYDCVGDTETQLLDLDDRVVSDSQGEEESEGTQVLDVEEEVSMTSGDEQLVDGERSHCKDNDKTLSQHNAGGLHVSTTTFVVEESPELKPGYVRMHFTSVRAASLRASGLAARNNSGSCSLPCSNHSLEQLPTIGGMEVDHGNDMDPNDDKRKGSTVRKLFADDPDAETEGFHHESDSFEEGEDLLQLPSCDLAGLSYADSQEPGELSQANALNFVDKFLQDNADEFDEEEDCRKSSKKITKVVTSAKGPQILAKKANEISLVTDAGIYEWDENREDEGGGELFCRKRTDFFSGGSRGSKSLPQPRKLKRNRGDELNDNKQNLQGMNKKISVVHSDSKLLVQNRKVSDMVEYEDELRLERNLTNEFDEQFNMCSTRGQLDCHVNKTQMPEMLNVGFDTQIAAEAMEALFNGEGVSNSEVNNAIYRNSLEGSLGEKTKNLSVKKPPSRKRASLSDAGVDSQKSQPAKKTRRVDPNSIKDFSTAPLKISKNAGKSHETPLVITKSKKAKSRAVNHANSQKKTLERVASVSIDQGKEGSTKQNLQNGSSLAPIARRTRQSMLLNQLNEAENPSSGCGGESNYVLQDFAGVQLGEDSSKLGQNQASRVGNTKHNQKEHADVNFEAVGNGIKLDGLSFRRGRRSRRIMSSKVDGPDNLDIPSEPADNREKFENCGTRLKRSQDARSTTVDNTFKRETRSSTRGSLVIKNLEEKSTQKKLDIGGYDGGAPHCKFSHNDGKTISEKINVEKTVRVPDRLHDARPSSLKMRDESPCQKGSCQQSDAACTTPVNHKKVSVNDASPVCMGNEYFRQSCKRSLSRPSLLKELRDLSPLEYEATSASKDLRKRRRDMTDVRVLYSHHLDDDIIKQQKKVVSRLGVSIASSMADATHFIADQFVRTRNMLEAIASGKPVVTHLWLECCGQANCVIDEKNYILRDSKKEREFGFSMPASLARACQYPLLKDRKVFITPNTKPGKETIASLVKAVNGQAVERIGKSALSADQIPDNLLVLSCEEDYEICVPLLEKGAAVYSSELVLNGIVTQRLEFERHRLFTDQVKKTRSTIWLRKDGKKFQSVSKKRK